MTKIPKCPSCKKELKTVIQLEESLYKFDQVTGTYAEDGISGSLDVTCDCGEDLTDEIFPDGVINFQQEGK